MKDTALIVVDMLYDFIDGSMACLHAEEAVAGARKVIEALTADKPGDEASIQAAFPILFVRDHHPADHCSFTAQGGPWPAHCVQGTRGAEVHEALRPYMEEGLVFCKGEDRTKEQYSGFEGRNAAGQSLGEVLHLLEIRHVHVVGIATEYCVRNTAEDLLRAGFRVTVREEALAWVDAGGHREALAAMRTEGIAVV